MEKIIIGSRKTAAAAAKSLQSCPTLCNPRDSSPPGSPVPGILQARVLAWGAISFSNAWKWSRSVVSNPQRPHGLQPSRLLHPWDFPGKSTGVGCHCLLLRKTSFLQKNICSYIKLFVTTSMKILSTSTLSIELCVVMIFLVFITCSIIGSNNPTKNKLLESQVSFFSFLYPPNHIIDTY